MVSARLRSRDLSKEDLPAEMISQLATSLLGTRIKCRPKVVLAHTNGLLRQFFPKGTNFKMVAVSVAHVLVEAL